MSFAVGAALPFPSPVSCAKFRHDALICLSDAECARAVRSFVEEGVARGQPVFMVVPRDRMEHLPGLSAVDFRDVRSVGSNPGRLIPLILDYCQHVADNLRVRVVVEPLYPGQTCAEVDEVVVHEALSNLAFANLQVSMLCVYHALDLREEVVGPIRACHPGDQPGRPDQWKGWVERALPPPPKDAAQIEVSEGTLSSIRHLLRRTAISQGLQPDRATDLVFAANEVATNAVVHGPGMGLMRVWTERNQLVCQVEDPGWITDPLVGRRPPDEGATGQRGLWMVHQLCDLVELRSGPKGTTVRLRVSLDHPAGS